MNGRRAIAQHRLPCEDAVLPVKRLLKIASCPMASHCEATMTANRFPWFPPVPELLGTAELVLRFRTLVREPGTGGST